MSDNAVEYKSNNIIFKKDSVELDKNGYVFADEKVLGSKYAERDNIDFELENHEHKEINGRHFYTPKQDNRTKTYAVEYAKDGVLIKGFIDGVLTDSGIVKFNRKDKLDVN